jgi:hypothetical protein
MLGSASAHGATVATDCDEEDSSLANAEQYMKVRRSPLSESAARLTDFSELLSALTPTSRSKVLRP